MRRITFVLTMVAVAALLPATAKAAFPGTNGRLAYHTNRYSYIRTIEPDGTDDMKLRDDVRQESDPSWSADGSRIVFVRSGRSGTQLATTAADGSDLQVIAGDSTLPRHPETPVWSPDASMIAFCAWGHDDNLKVFVIGIDGTGVTNISGPGNDDCHPAWSPDGARIAVDANGSDIVTMDADGSDRTTVVSEGYTFWPDWSPDGTQLAYVMDIPRTTNIYTVDSSGGTPTRLMTTHAFEQTPSWSPDGTAIAYCKSRRYGDPCDLFTVAPDGTGVTRITATRQRSESHPDWQPLP